VDHPENVESRERERKALLFECALIWLATFSFYLLVLSRQYAGDGVRYIPELSVRHPEFGMNKHVMFPALFWALADFGRRSGLLALFANQFERPGLLVLCQGLNAYLGALGIALLYLWQRVRGGRRQLSLVLCGVVALSNAYAMHATDMTEPIAAVPWVLAGATVAHLYPDRFRGVLIGGALVGLGATFYIAALLGCALVGSVAVTRFERTRSLVGALGVAGAIGGTAIASYLVSFVILSWFLRPETALPGVLASTVQFSTDQGLYGSLNPKHLAGAVFGFANAWAPLASFEGGSRIWRARPADVAYNLFITLLAVAAAMGLVLRLVRKRAETFRLHSAGDVIGASVWLAAIFLLTATWSPTYEKLWLFGAIATACLAAAIFGRSAPLEPRSQLWPVALLAVLALLSLAKGIVPRRFGSNGDLEGAAKLATRVTGSDLLVCPGWDPTSVYYKTLSNPPRECWAIVDTAIAEGLNGQAVSASLSAAIAQTLKNGQRVFFVGLLDLGEQDWRPFYEQRLKMPFALLSPYRRRAELAFRLPSSTGTDQPVFRYCGETGC
jgi:hypothetical protein